MEEKQFKVYGYRWVVLAVFMFANLAIQGLWIAYAPITGPAASFYGVTDLSIGMLSMVFMLAFIPLSIPVSWLIDTYGFKIAVGIGVVMMSIFGIARGLAGQNYTLVLLFTIGIAAAQPFLLNTWMKVPANWFAPNERATAVGLVTLANLVGMALGMVLTPVLIESFSIPHIQLVYGAVAAFSALLFLIFARENPPTPACPPGQEERTLMFDGLKQALKVKQFWYWLLITFIGLGLFNGISTWIEGIVRPRGFTPTDAGTLGAVLLLGGVIGAVLLPALSDKTGKRQLFLYIGVGLAIPGLIGVAYSRSLFALLASGFVLGFFLVSANPIGMQYSAEVTFPTPEGTLNGLIQLFGQASVVFVYIMEAFRSPDGSFTNALLFGAAMLVICLFLVSRMKDVQEKEEMDEPVQLQPDGVSGK
ncbi:MAG: MFS transporter [Anaerolineaceae bacterium]|jgi:MFS family permease